MFQPEYEYVAGGHAGWTYVKAHWAHGPNWLPHRLPGDKWYDFDAIRLEGFEPEIWLVPLPGHTPGHSAVAVRHEGGWVLHAGDAVPFNMMIDAVPDWLTRLLLGPHTPRIREFMRAHAEVQVVGAHMALDFYGKP